MRERGFEGYIIYQSELKRPNNKQSDFRYQNPHQILYLFTNKNPLNSFKNPIVVVVLFSYFFCERGK